MIIRPAIFATLLAVAGCAQQPDSAVSDGMVRLPAVEGSPGAAYFTLHGGDAGRTLVTVESPDAGRADRLETLLAALGADVNDDKRHDEDGAADPRCCDPEKWHRHFCPGWQACHAVRDEGGPEAGGSHFAELHLCQWGNCPIDGRGRKPRRV